MISLQKVLSNYGITLLLTNASVKHLANELSKARGQKWSLGPRDASILWPNTVIAAEFASPEDILHETCHLVGASQFSDIKKECEGSAVLQLEYCIGKMFSKSIQNRIARYRMETIVDQLEIRDTPFGRTKFLPVAPGYQRQRWWIEGFTRAVNLGLLTNDHQPTWKRRPFK